MTTSHVFDIVAFLLVYRLIAVMMIDTIDNFFVLAIAHS